MALKYRQNRWIWLTVFCLFWSHVCGGMPSARLAMYCFANCPIVFSGRAWLIYLAGCCCSTQPLKVTRCWSQSGDPIVPAKAPRTLPEPSRHSDGVLKNLWARCHCGTRHWCSLSSGLPCGGAVAGRRVRSSGIFVQVLDSATLTGRSSLATLWKRIAVWQTGQA